MLFNPKWLEAIVVKPKYRTCSTRDFIAWLGEHDPNQVYDFYDNCGNCLMGQYMKACGVGWNNDRAPNYRKFIVKVFGSVAAEHEVLNGNEFYTWSKPTFGGALQRTEDWFVNYPQYMPDNRLVRS